MQQILNLIEETLDTDITPEELAERSGYSLWYFMHLFSQQVGMPLNRYRTRRRLAHAIWHVSLGMQVTDAALRWGFDTHSGFFRAFRREYGMSPMLYLRTHQAAVPSVPQLKEEVYKMLTRERVREALTRWGAEYAALPLIPVTYPDGSASESALYVGGNLVLKAYRDEGSCRLAVSLAQALASQGIPAAAALPLPDGQMFLTYPEGLWTTLCRRVPGTPMKAAELILHPHCGRRIGAALAQLHLAIAAMGETPDADDDPYADHILNWALPRAAGALPDNFPADYARQVEHLRCLPAALIHRDPNPSNLIDCGEKIGFIDFDLSRRFVRIFDPCYTMTAVLSETFEHADLPWAENWPAFSRAVLEGYNEVSPFSKEEWQSIPTVLIGNELLSLAAFADSIKYQHVFETNRRMLPWMLKHMPL